MKTLHLVKVVSDFRKIWYNNNGTGSFSIAKRLQVKPTLSIGIGFSGPDIEPYYIGEFYWLYQIDNQAQQAHTQRAIVELVKEKNIGRIVVPKTVYLPSVHEDKTKELDAIFVETCKGLNYPDGDFVPELLFLDDVNWKDIPDMVEEAEGYSSVLPVLECLPDMKVSTLTMIKHLLKVPALASA